MSKRVATRPPITLTADDNHDNVKEYLKSFLSPEDFTQVTEAFVASQQHPDGEVLLSCEENDLEALGITAFTLRRKIALHLREARAAVSQAALDAPPATAIKREEGVEELRDSEEEDSDDGPHEATPAPGAQQVLTNHKLMPTTGVARAAANIAANGPSSAAATTTGAGTSARPTTADPRRVPQNVRARLTERLQAATAAPRMTRQRASRMAAIDQAAERNHVVAEKADDDVQIVYDGEEVEEMDEDLLPETVDDGVTPENSDWSQAARFALEMMLKELPADALKKIIEDKMWPSNLHTYRAYNSARQCHEMKSRTRGYMAAKITKMSFDGTLTGVQEAGSSSWEMVEEMINEYIDISIVRDFLDNHYKIMFADTPVIHDPVKLLRRLCCHPKGKEDPIYCEIGQITMPYKEFRGKLREAWENTVSIEQAELATLKLAPALDALLPKQQPVRIKNDDGSVTVVPGNEVAPDLVLMKNDEVDYVDLLLQLNALRARGDGGSITADISFDTDASNMVVHIFAVFAKEGSHTSSEITVNGCYRKNATGDDEACLVNVDMSKIVANLDHMKGTELTERVLEGLNEEWDAACDALEEHGVPVELDLSTPTNFSTFDKIMVGLEDMDRPLRPGLTTEAKDVLEMRLKAYQNRALSFMLDEEQSEGGTARHFWIQVPLPHAVDPEDECQVWISPIFSQIKVFKSKIRAAQAVGSCGGSGWIALEMGMGKTAVILAGVAMNPPPDNWREPRPWTAHDPKDHLITVTENMPRGGTLVIVPATLLNQWNNEVNKTLMDPEETTVLRWCEGLKEMDCRIIAGYDIVLTTPQMANKFPNLSSIFWHRIVVDEGHKDSAAILESKDYQWYSHHRWIVTGTPCNQTVDSISPSLQFLRFGAFETSHKYLPPVLATVLRAAMVRYTKDGKIGGETNLKLPPLTERTVMCAMDDDDVALYGGAERDAHAFFLKGLKKAKIILDDNLEGNMRHNPEGMNELFAGKKLALPMKRTLDQLRGKAAGGLGIENGEIEYCPRTAKHLPVKVVTKSKAKALIADLKELKESDPDSKILVFSEFPETLRTVEDLLPSIGLNHRSLYGSTSVKKRGEAIESFMTDLPTRVFLLSAGAGGVGITLTAASHVYLMEPLMNHSMELQAIGRSRRMGQTKPVTVTRLVMENSIESRLKQFLTHRRANKVQSTALMGNAAATSLKFTVLDYEELLTADPKYAQDSDDDEVMEVVGEHDGEVDGLDW